MRLFLARADPQSSANPEAVRQFRDDRIAYWMTARREARKHADAPLDTDYWRCLYVPEHRGPTHNVVARGFQGEKVFTDTIALLKDRVCRSCPVNLHDELASIPTGTL